MLREARRTLPDCWGRFVKESPHVDGIERYLSEEKAKWGDELAIFPRPSDVFAALRWTPLSSVRVVVIGQDCYHGAGQANGLCFSVPEGVKPPPSLRNIVKEMKACVGCAPSTTDFTYLARQGVLLMNCALTVREHCPGSHAAIWKPFTDDVIRHVSTHASQPVVFLLWGNFAKKKERLIGGDRHLVLRAHHPSPLSANRGGWFGSAHFAKINNFLRERGDVEIDWRGGADDE